MDFRKSNKLLDKYWKGETSPEEEALLRANAKNFEEDSERSYFKEVAAFSELSLDTDFADTIIAKIATKENSKIRRIRPVFYLKIAASVAICLSLYFLYQPIEEPMNRPLVEAEEDPEKAFELTKQALLLVSLKLNKASDVTVALDKFSETQEKIQTK